MLLFELLADVHNFSGLGLDCFARGKSNNIVKYFQGAEQRNIGDLFGLPEQFGVYPHLCPYLMEQGDNGLFFVLVQPCLEPDR